MKYIIIKKNILVELLYRVFVILTSLALTVGSGASASALSNDEYKIYSDNHIYFYDSSACVQKNYNSSGGVSVSGGTMEEKIWNGLRSFMTPEQAAGAMGNMAHEGSMNPVLHEGSFQNSGRDIFTDTRVSYGVGLIQWSWERRVNMLNYLLSKDPSLKQYFTGHTYNKNFTGGDLFYSQLAQEIGDDMAQAVADELVSLELAWLKNEMENSREMRLSDKNWAEYFNINDVEEAAVYFLWYIESPNDKEGQRPIRVADAKVYYEMFAGNDAGGATNSAGSGGCSYLRSSPDYNSISYQQKLSNLDAFSQISSVGKFGKEKMCDNDPGSSTISGGGCGIMSIAAAYYMFSGVGLNDADNFKQIKKAAQDDGYNICNMSDREKYGSHLEAYTNMSANKVYDLSWNRMVEELSKGNKIIISTGNSNFTRSSGHLMLLDHYNAEKNMIYMFDPAMMDDRKTNLDARIASNGNSYIEYFEGSPYDGLYMSERAMADLVQPRNMLLVLTYDGCYDGGSSGVHVNICGGTSVFLGLQSGGMTYEQAVDFMSAYRNEAEKQLSGHYGAGYANGDVIGVGFVNDARCHGGTLNNCSAFSQWFVNNFTTLGPGVGSWDGRAFANGLIALGFLDGGSLPAPYAIFSENGGEWGHTGVVLGMDESKDEIYIGEAGCTAGFTGTWPGVHTRSLSSFINGQYVYAYPGSLLKL